MTNDVGLIVGLVVAFAAAVFLAAAETSLLRVSPVRAGTLAEEHGVRGRRLLRLTGRLTRVLNTILLMALLAQIAAATIVGILAERWFGSLGVTIASVLLTIVLFIYAEAIPKTFAVRNVDRVAMLVSGPVTALEIVLRPIVAALVWIADMQAPGKGIATPPTVTEGELLVLTGQAAEEGQIEPDDRDLVQRAFRFGDRQTDDIMVPRTDIVGVRSDSPIERALEVTLQTGHRRIVVYEESLDDISGVVGLREMVAVPAERTGLEVGVLSEPPLVVPETKSVVALLREMQESGTHLAIVVDEYGGTAGLVTVEDIAEELLGSISEDSDDPVVVIDDTTWSIDGLLPIEDLETLLGVSFGDGDWNTAGGLVISRLGRLAEVGDEVAESGSTLRVTAIRGRRVLRMEVSLDP